MMSGKNHQLFKEPIGTTVTAEAHVFSDYVFCRGLGALDPTSASKICEKKAEDGMKSAGQSIDIGRHVCLGARQCKYGDRSKGP